MIFIIIIIKYSRRDIFNHGLAMAETQKHIICKMKVFDYICEVRHLEGARSFFPWNYISNFFYFKFYTRTKITLSVACNANKQI